MVLARSHDSLDGPECSGMFHDDRVGQNSRCGLSLQCLQRKRYLRGIRGQLMDRQVKD